VAAALGGEADDAPQATMERITGSVMAAFTASRSRCRDVVMAWRRSRRRILWEHPHVHAVTRHWPKI